MPSARLDVIIIVISSSSITIILFVQAKLKFNSSVASIVVATVNIPWVLEIVHTSRSPATAKCRYDGEYFFENIITMIRLCSSFLATVQCFVG